MIQVRHISKTDKETIDDIVRIHLDTFQGFFLTFMGRSFLKLMYRSYIEYGSSDILVAFEDGKPIGFLA